MVTFLFPIIQWTLFVLIGLGMLGIAVGYWPGYRQRRIPPAASIEDELHFGSLFLHHPDMVVEVDGEGKIRNINPVVFKISGYERGELIGQSYLEILQDWGSDAQEHYHEHHLRRESGLTGTVELTTHRKDGSLLYLECTYIPHIMNGRYLGFYAICKDITTTKAIQQALIDSEAKYRYITDNITDMVGVMNLKGEYLFLSPSCSELISNLAAQEPAIRSYEDFLIYEEEKVMIRHCFARLLETGQLESLRVHVYGDEGKILCLEARAALIRDAAGNPDRIIVVSRDISEQERMEEALKESEQKYRLLIEANPVAVVLSKNREIVYANSSCLELLGGQKSEDLIGRRTDVIFPETSSLKFEEEISSTGMKQKNGLREVHVKRLDGESIYVEVVSTPLITEPDGVTYLSIARDITRRKVAEEQKKQVEQLLRDNQALNLRLQESLDRFSADVFGVLQKKEVERRLAKEVSHILGIEDVWIMEKEMTAQERYDANQYPIGELISWGGKQACKIGGSSNCITIMIIDGESELLALEPVRVWLKTLTRHAHVLYDNFRVIRDLTIELEQQLESRQTSPWLMRVIFNLSEKERKKLSQDLHDSALQEQIIWYRKLAAVCHTTELDNELREELNRISEGLLDVIYQIRLTCHELRPPMLMEYGINEALKQLFNQVQLRSDFSISFEETSPDMMLNDEQSIGLYRIIQELLANTAKHSDATDVHLHLFRDADSVYLRYSDNGIGMNLDTIGQFNHSMGMNGMIERVKSLEGDIDFESSPHKGLEVSICFPILLTPPVAVSYIRESR